MWELLYKMKKKRRQRVIGMTSDDSGLGLRSGESEDGFSYLNSNLNFAHAGRSLEGALGCKELGQGG